MVDLNQYQKSFVDNLGEGACVVMAAAGSGKTRTMVELLIAMIGHGVDPRQILAVTFTTKAAAEMRERIALAVWGDRISDRELQFLKDPKGQQEESDNPLDIQFDRAWVEADPVRQFLVDWVCTIHAMSFRLLKIIDPNIKSLRKRNEWDLAAIVKDSLDEFKWIQSPKIVQWYIDHAIEDMVDHSQFKRVRDYFEKLIIERNFGFYPDDCEADAPDMLAEIYMRYMRYMKSHRLVNFGMMQSELLRKLKSDAAFRTKLQSMFKYIIVDEAQDTDAHQAEIIWTIADMFKNVSFIGDTRQSIYAFRGARPDLMEVGFEQRWSTARQFTFPVNYRSSKIIIDLSNRLISHNYPGDRAKYCVPAQARPDAPDGDDPEYCEYTQFKPMVNAIIQQIMETGEFGKWYVLSRTRAECAAIHAQMVEQRVPAINLSGGNLFGAAHIRKVMAYAKLACDYKGARNNQEILKEVANIASVNFVAPMTRRMHKDGCDNQKPWVDCGCPVIIREGMDNSPMRYYGEKAIEAAGSRWSGIVAQQYETNRGGFPSLNAKGASDFVQFVSSIEKLKGDAEAAINKIIDESIMPWLMHEEGVDGDDLSENGKSEDFDILRGMMKPGMTLEQFIDDAEELLERGSGTNEDDSVVIMTIHKAKGLERPYVALNTTRLPIVPPKRKEGQLPTSFPATIQEERNLAYVGFSRAKEKCFLYGSLEWNGQRTSRSPFVGEFGFSFEEEDVDSIEDVLQD